jgi:PAS domain S-box-containing protein
LKTSPSNDRLQNETSIDYSKLFCDLPESYLLFDAASPYVVVDMNKAREKLLGLNREDCIGRPLFDVYPYTSERFRATAGQNLRERFKQLVRTGRSQQLEPFSQSVTGVDGERRTAYMQLTYFPVRAASGRVLYILSDAHEVTEELQATERVTIAEDRLDAALTMGKLGSWVFDVEKRRIIGDASFIRLFNMTKEYAAAYTLDDFLREVHEEDRARVTAAVRQSIKDLTPFEEEFRVIISDGSLRWVLARAKAEVRDGRLTFPGVVVDMTEQRNLEEQVEVARRQDRLNRRAARILQQRNEELEAISRSKDEFVALASHQLRTPATAVKQYIGMMLQDYVGDITSEQRDVLTKAFDSNERQIKIINQILSAARADTGRLVMTPLLVDLCSLVRSVAADMEPQIRERKHTLTFDVPETPIRVWADVGYIQMAIENIVHNASIYTPQGGAITMRLRVRGEKCKISISDTGVGIKKKDLGKLFVKFSRIHNPLSVEAGGSGIGLYLTAEIVRLHNGTISVKSRLHEGTTFAISLPLMQNGNTLKPANIGVK